jgi:hypothetical protein
MRIALFSTLLLLLLACTTQHEQELEVNLTNATTQIAALNVQLNETLQDVRKYDQLYEQKIGELKDTQTQLSDIQRQLAFEKLQKEKFQQFYETCDAQLAKYLPKPLLSTTYLTPSYDDLLRNSEQYVGSNVRIEGEVLQVTQRDDGTFVLRVAITDKGYYWTDAVWVEYTGKRVLENDLVTVAGRFEGLTTYQAVLGNAITIPKITADSVSVTVKAADR